MRFESLKERQLAGQDDSDGQFIVLWIAFNAAYATDIDEKYRESEQQTFRSFLEKLTQLDAGKKRFEQLVWVNAIGSGTEIECLGVSRERRHADVRLGSSGARTAQRRWSFTLGPETLTRQSQMCRRRPQHYTCAVHLDADGCRLVG